MGMNNAAYEVVRQAKLQDACKFFLVFFRISSLTPKTWEHMLQLKNKLVKCKFFPLLINDLTPGKKNAG